MTAADKKKIQYTVGVIWRISGSGLFRKFGFKCRIFFGQDFGEIIGICGGGVR